MRTGVILILAVLVFLAYTAVQEEAQDRECREQLVDAVVVALSEDGTDTDIERAERLLGVCK